MTDFTYDTAPLRSALLRRVFRVLHHERKRLGVIALGAGVLLGAYQIRSTLITCWQMLQSPGPFVCELTPADLPHSDTPDTPGQLPTPIVATQVTSANSIMPCPDLGSKHSPR